MTLSGRATAGIIVAIVVILSLGLGAFYYTKRRSQRNTPPEATDPILPTDSGSPAISSLRQFNGINKRAGISDQQHHIRYPSLEHGPGPTLITQAGPETPTIDTIRAVTATPTTSRSSTRVQPPDNAASNNRSSLYQAVLDAGAEDDQKSDNDAVKKADDVATAKELKHSPVGNPYSGAWPQREINAAFEDRRTKEIYGADLSRQRSS